MLTASAYGATCATEPLTAMTTRRRDLGPHDVLIDIKYCGICHTDISRARSEWRPEPYPLVPGHELTGIAAAIGPDVTGHAIGDRVGVSGHNLVAQRRIITGSLIGGLHETRDMLGSCAQHHLTRAAIKAGVSANTTHAYARQWANFEACCTDVGSSDSPPG